MNYDLAKMAPFGGFGVQTWMAMAHPEEEEALLRQLHVRYVRVSIQARLGPENLAGHPDVETILDKLINNSAPKVDLGKLSQFHDMVDRLGLEVHLISWEMPAPWRIELGKGNGFTRKGAASEHIPDYVNYVVAELLWAKHYGFNPAAIELTNEPEGAWNTEYTPEQYDDLLRQAYEALKQYGLGSVGIEGPGTGHMFSADPFLAKLKQSGDLGRLRNLSFHDYDTVKFPEPLGLAPLPADIDRRANALPIYITEVNESTDPRWKKPPYDKEPNQRGGANNAADSAEYAVSTAGELLKLIADGAHAVFYWQAEDPPWADNSTGLLDLNGHPRPLVAALSTFLALLPRDVPAIGGSGPVHDLVGVAFRRSSDTVVAMTNQSNRPYLVRVKLSGLGHPIKSVASLSQFQVNETAGSSTATVAGSDTINFSLQPRAVVSLSVQ